MLIITSNKTKSRQYKKGKLASHSEQIMPPLFSGTADLPLVPI